MFLVENYNDLGYQAYNVGGNDLADGLDFVTQLETSAHFPFISANITRTGEIQPVFKPYVILSEGRRKFGIIGVCSKPTYAIEGCTVSDPVEALSIYIKEIENSVDFVIVMAATNDADEAEILSAGLPIDLLLRSNTYRYTRSLAGESEIPVARVGNIGKYVGWIQMTIRNKNMPLKDVSKLKSQIDYAQKRLDSFKASAGDKSLEEYYADRSNLLNIIHSLQQHQAQLQAEIETIENPIDFGLIPLDKDIADDPVVLQQVETHKKKYGITGPLERIAH